MGVNPGSTAERLGLRPGDQILTVNNDAVDDVIDFQFAAAEERLTLVVRKRGGLSKRLALNKTIDDNLGIEFSPLAVKRCRNRCVFCFVDQMPSGCRKTLYVKDDDFRASFLYGNFITLGALSEADWARILRQRLSPLYISVHATEPALRSALLRNKKAPPILESLKRLADGGIRMHTQIVLCPGLNDGAHLMQTLEDLAGLVPAVLSIAVVPVGLTAFRQGLVPLRTFKKKEARSVLDTVRFYERRFQRQLGTRLVFPSDEFFIRAGEPVPAASFYEDFPQIENGVGMVASLYREASMTRLPVRVDPVLATIVTGESFARVSTPVIQRLGRIGGVNVRQIVVRNRFFGPTVTVTGLLTGSDILSQLKGKRLGDVVVIPSNVLKEDEPVFLDGMTLEELERRLNVSVVSFDGFRDLVRVLRGREGRRA
jgi:putative radical SAM enzyme (TIGR03279 family)